MLVVVAAVCGLALLWSTALSQTTTTSPAPVTFPDLPAPSIGDVQLVDVTYPGDGRVKGTVEIYYDDGVRGPRWGYVCKSSALKATAQVVCRQLGYSSADLNIYEAQSEQESETQQVEGGVSSGDAPPRDNGDHPVWLIDIRCEENSNFSHILRCPHTVSSDGGSCKNLLVVSCYNGQPLAPYTGQVRLCPPTGFPSNTQSTSFGVVQVYFQSDWGGVNQYYWNVSLGAYEADSICRQLGYTNAVTSYTMTVGSAKIVQSLEFGDCLNLPNTITAWVMTNDSTCERSQDCFSCCFSYPSKQPSSVCSFDKDVVIKCGFDHTIADDAGGGSAELCKFDNGQRSSQACSNSPDWKRRFEITVGVVGSLALVLFCVLVVIGIVYCVRRRGDRNGGGEQQRLLRRQDDEN